MVVVVVEHVEAYERVMICMYIAGRLGHLYHFE